jgi:putative addiction module component (TIGR02574 family)
MSPTSNQLYESALSLSNDERARLADRLWESLDGDTREEVAEAWAAEISRRIAAADRGEVKFLSHEEVWQRLEAKNGNSSDSVSS